MSCPGNQRWCMLTCINWGHITLASIRGGLPMISNILTLLSFFVMLLSSIIDYNFPSRLLGVLYQ